MSQITIRTNNIPRFTLDAYELSEKERKEFDYLDWEAIDKGEDSATFFRYKGQVYCLHEFMRVTDTMILRNGSYLGWNGYLFDSFFSGILVKFPNNDLRSVILGQYFS